MAKMTADRDEKVAALLRRALPSWKGTTVKQRLKNGLVTVNGRPASGGDLVSPGDCVEIQGKQASPASRFLAGMGEPPLEILFADEYLLAVNKPSGLLSVASERERSNTAVRLMREWLGDEGWQGAKDLHAAHRLDRDASGVLLFTHGLAVKRRLAAEWHEFQKMYMAVVDGVPQDTAGTVDAPLWEDKGLFVRVADARGGERTVTHYRVIKSNGRRSLLEVSIETGKKHQIRVHLAHIGCPIVGDVRYGVSKASRLALHAHTLRVRHPADGHALAISAPTPPQFKRWLVTGKR